MTDDDFPQAEENLVGNEREVRHTHFERARKEALDRLNDPALVRQRVQRSRTYGVGGLLPPVGGPAQQPPLPAVPRGPYILADAVEPDDAAEACDRVPLLPSDLRLLTERERPLMGTSGNPARRAPETRRTKTPRNALDVSIDRPRSLVILDVGGQVTGMTVQTCDALIESLANARADLTSNADHHPHSRACAIMRHDHGTDCHANCPTCQGQPFSAAEPV